MSYIDRQVELRNRAWEEAKAILDVAEAEKRDLSAEEEVKYARINEDLGKRAEVISSPVSYTHLTLPTNREV